MIDSCLACNAGEYQPLTGSIECNLCGAGTYQPATGQTECVLCAPGGYCNDARSCGGGWTACSSGTFNPGVGSSSSTACVVCPAGTANPVDGSTALGACKPCLPGSFAAVAGADTCELCPAGNFTGSSGSTACKPCAKGHYCTKGAAVSLPCPGGTYSGKSGLTSKSGCLDVVLGSWAPTGSAKPIACPKSGFICPGAADLAAHTSANITPAGSQPIQLDLGSIPSEPKPYVTEMPSVELTLTLEADLDSFDNVTLIAQISQLYGIAQDLIEIGDVRGGSTVLVVRIAEESRAILTELVAAIDDSALSAALGVNSTRSSTVEITRNVTRVRIEQMSCTPGHWCTAGVEINCNVGFFNPNSDDHLATACVHCRASCHHVRRGGDHHQAVHLRGAAL